MTRCPTNYAMVCDGHSILSSLATGFIKAVVYSGWCNVLIITSRLFWALVEQAMYESAQGGMLAIVLGLLAVAVARPLGGRRQRQTRAKHFNGRQAGLGIDILKAEANEHLCKCLQDVHAHLDVARMMNLREVHNLACLACPLRAPASSKTTRPKQALL